VVLGPGGLSRHPADSFLQGILVRRKSSKTMIDIDRNVSIVHLNVSAGYVTYLQKDDAARPPSVKAIFLEHFEAPAQ
jgi:hypothetical protein